MMLYQIRVVYEPQPIPEAPQIEAKMPRHIEEELVEVSAETIESALHRVPLFTTISSSGRLVRYFDMQGRELFARL